MQAMLILAHKDLEQLIKLIQVLKQDFEIYVHIDTKTILPDTAKSWLEENQIHYYQSIDVRWGGWGISEATILLLREAMKNPSIEYIHILSGQDWVATSPSKIKKFYESNANAYMLYSKAKDEIKSGEPIILWQKYYYNYDRINRRSTFGKIYHRIIFALQTILRVDKFKKLGITDTIYQGPNWMDLPRDIVEYLLEYYDSHENIRELFRTGYCPDEFWVQTILCNSEYKNRIVKDYHRYIKWEEKHGSYPAILDEQEYKEISQGDYHFIRKVDLTHSEKLMKVLASND